MSDRVDDWVQRNRGRELVAAIDDFIDETAPAPDQEAYGFPHGWRSMFLDGVMSCTPVGSNGDLLRRALAEARELMIATGKRGVLIGTVVSSPTDQLGPIGISPAVFNSWLELSRNNSLTYRDSSGSSYTFFDVRIGTVSNANAPGTPASVAEIQAVLREEIDEARRLRTRPGREVIFTGAKKRLARLGKTAKTADLRTEYARIPNRPPRGRPSTRTPAQ